MNKHFQMGKLRREECGSEPQEKKKKNNTEKGIQKMKQKIIEGKRNYE